MNRKSIQTETFATDNGIAITIELTQDRPQSITIKFPGSGRAPIDLSAVDIKELAETTLAARDFLQTPSQPASQIG